MSGDPSQDWTDSVPTYEQGWHPERHGFSADTPILRARAPSTWMWHYFPGDSNRSLCGVHRLQHLIHWRDIDQGEGTDCGRCRYSHWVISGKPGKWEPRR